MCATRRAWAELRLAATLQPHFPAPLDHGRFTPTPTARPRQAFPVNNAYDGPISLLTVGGPATARFDSAHPEFGRVLTKLPDEP